MAELASRQSNVINGKAAQLPRLALKSWEYFTLYARLKWIEKCAIPSENNGFPGDTFLATHLCVIGAEVFGSVFSHVSRLCCHSNVQHKDGCFHSHYWFHLHLFETPIASCHLNSVVIFSSYLMFLFLKLYMLCTEHHMYSIQIWKKHKSKSSFQPVTLSQSCLSSGRGPDGQGNVPAQ